MHMVVHVRDIGWMELRAGHNRQIKGSESIDTRPKGGCSEKRLKSWFVFLVSLQDSQV